MRFPLSLRIFLALVVFALVVAACGDSGDTSTAEPTPTEVPEPAPPETAPPVPPEPEPPVEPEPPELEPVTRADYIASADVICLEVEEQLDALAEPETLQDVVGLSVEAKGYTEVGLSRLAALELPVGDEAMVAAVFDPLREQVELFDDLASAAAVEDEEAIANLVAQGEQLDAETHEAALAYGFVECGIDDERVDGEPTDGSASGGATEPDNGDLTIQYVRPTTPELQAAFEFLQESRVLDDIVEGVNDTLALREDVLVSVEEFPDNPGPAYYASARAIVMPLEFVELVADILIQGGIVETEEELEAHTLAVMAFVFLHEVGHALVDQLEIPITGKEEDAVDQLATVVVTDAGGDAGFVAVSAATLFGAFAANRDTFDLADFWDEHSLDEQRFFNLLCWVYGADSSIYGEIAELGIEEDRLVRCQDEYAQIKRSWETLLAPYLKNA